uniref:Uncharacterized protein n=1 Tax=Vespula pensylvanica TaxID=30213 RepID=A0A834UEF6_VESPE|nr:hypothetical protein H0235_002718 [Vespula pensylvanica]
MRETQLSQGGFWTRILSDSKKPTAGVNTHIGTCLDDEKTGQGEKKLNGARPWANAFTFADSRTPAHTELLFSSGEEERIRVVDRLAGYDEEQACHTPSSIHRYQTPTCDLNAHRLLIRHVDSLRGSLSDGLEVWKNRKQLAVNQNRATEIADSVVNIKWLLSTETRTTNGALLEFTFTKISSSWPSSSSSSSSAYSSKRSCPGAFAITPHERSSFLRKISSKSITRLVNERESQWRESELRRIAHSGKQQPVPVYGYLREYERA